MNRRIVGRTVAAVGLLSLPGCLSGGSGGGSNDSDSPDTTDSATSDSESDVVDSDLIAASTLTRTGDCAEAGVATITFSDTDPEATIVGCVSGHNGCAEPVVDSATESDDSFRIVMGEADLSGSETLCTQSLVQRGYELHLRFATAVPPTIDVVHDDVDGREVVATADSP